LIASDVTVVSFAVRRRVLCALHVGVVDGIHAEMCLCFAGRFLSWMYVERNLLWVSDQVEDCLHSTTRMVLLYLMEVTSCGPELHGRNSVAPHSNADVFSDIPLFSGEFYPPPYIQNCATKVAIEMHNTFQR
jgi:hypothetical protein